MNHPSLCPIIPHKVFCWIGEYHHRDFEGTHRKWTSTLKGKTQGSDECLLSRPSDTHGGMHFVVVIGDRSGKTQRVNIKVWRNSLTAWGVRRLEKLTVFWKWQCFVFVFQSWFQWAAGARGKLTGSGCLGLVPASWLKRKLINENFRFLLSWGLIHQGKHEALL